MGLPGIVMVKWAEGVLLQAIPIDRSGDQPLALQIAAGLREMILGGALRPGERLPATRTLAQELGVARATIVESFERLLAEGLLETRVGSGTYVSAVLDAERPSAPPPIEAAPTERARLARSMTHAAERFVARLPHEPRPFTTALPAYDAFPMAEWTRLATRHWRNPRHMVLGYPDPCGYRPLREAIAAHLRTNRGIRCDWRCVFIVAGAQQAFQLIAGTLIDPATGSGSRIRARSARATASSCRAPIWCRFRSMKPASASSAGSNSRRISRSPSSRRPISSRLGRNSAWSAASRF